MTPLAASHPFTASRPAGFSSDTEWFLGPVQRCARSAGPLAAVGDVLKPAELEPLSRAARRCVVVPAALNEFE